MADGVKKGLESHRGKLTLAISCESMMAGWNLGISETIGL